MMPTWLPTVLASEPSQDPSKVEDMADPSVDNTSVIEDCLTDDR